MGYQASRAERNRFASRPLLPAATMKLALNAAPARAALVLDVGAVLERLPAQVRASLAWTKAVHFSNLDRRNRAPAAVD